MQHEVGVTSAIDDVLRAVNREIWIVTVAHQESRGGLTATWVSGISLERQSPAMLVALGRRHHTTSLVDRSQTFLLHLLKPEQVGTALKFGINSGHTTDKFSDVEVTESANGNPRLTNCLGWLECRVYSRLEAADRCFYWADVVDGKRMAIEKPLTENDMMAAATDGQMKLLLEQKVRDGLFDVEARRAWKQNLPSFLSPSAHAD